MKRRTFLKLAIGTGGVTCLLGCYSVCIERYLVQFPHYRIPVPNLPPDFAGLKIVHITDIHYGFLVPSRFVKHLFDTVNHLEKDVIVCTGDYIHERNSTQQIDTIWPLLCELHAPLGVYSVLGNHDHWGSTPRSLYWLEQSGQNLRKKVTYLERNGQRVWFAGLGDFWEDPMNVDSLLQLIPDDECRIILAHNPDSADTPFQGRIDLMISGHTHGGQVKIPFYGPPILPVRNKTYSCGLKTSNKHHRVFISRGIGWAIYPIRFNCSPEIPILELIPA
jgi:predicted MPP superfamily phosphohydrolase